MEHLLKVLESKVRIQYQDCDPFNHLNNAKYIDYIVAARTEQLLVNYGLNTSELARENGTGWVAALTQVSYFKPASWMEVVTIQSKLIRFSETSLLVEAFMWDEHKSSIKAMMWAKLVHFNIKTQTSSRHPEVLMNLFRLVNDPPETEQSFEERVKSIKQTILKK